MTIKHRTKTSPAGIAGIYLSIREILQKAREGACRSVNFDMVRAGYGQFLLAAPSKKLAKGCDRGFDESNLRYMRLFYMVFPKCDALRHELSWTHYRLLLKVESPDARGFYLAEAINTATGVRASWNGKSIPCSMTASRSAKIRQKSKSFSIGKFRSFV